MTCLSIRDGGLISKSVHLYTSIINFLFFVMQETSFEKVEEGVGLEIRTRGVVFNRQRFKSKTTTIMQTFGDLVIADYCVSVAYTLRICNVYLTNFLLHLKLSV